MMRTRNLLVVCLLVLGGATVDQSVEEDKGAVIDPNGVAGHLVKGPVIDPNGAVVLRLAKGAVIDPNGTPGAMSISPDGALAV